MERLWLIAMKDLKIFLKDRTAAFFFIVFPLMFIVLFNFMMKGLGGEDQRLELHLATQEAAGGLSYQILGSMETKDESLLTRRADDGDYQLPGM
jgi:ABC-type Na+ efflux pump permease subunit